MLFPCLYHLPVLAEHPFTGTRGVDQYLIKILWEITRKLSRLFAEHKYVSDSKYLDIFKKSPCPRATQIIGHKDSVPSKPCSKLCSFSARRSTHIQHPVSRLNRKAACRRHSARLLQIVKSCIIVRMLRRDIRLTIVVVPIRNPRNRPNHERTDLFKFLCRYLIRIHPKPIITRLIITGNIVRKLFSQKLLHLLFKLFRQSHALPPSIRKLYPNECTFAHIFLVYHILLYNSRNMRILIYYFREILKDSRG